MSRSGVRRALRWASVAIAGVLITTALSASADARGRRHHRVDHNAQHESYDPAYASIVVDVNSGRVMQETNADSPRHPASLTKMMTLYLLFERLEAGKISLSSEMSVSEHAAEQAPSKLGLSPGDTIDVERAIKAIVTKSANDVAVVVAEALGGTESEFARMMTAKARELGMMRTTYHNASGLPDDRQITTARDQATLGRALQDRFPKYFPYFSTRFFAYHGKAIRNHNHLLGRVDGVNGIKTGYIHAAGFNIVTSVQRGNRRIVAVVFGGRTASWRDARVRGLIEANIDEAASKRTAPLVVEGWQGNVKLASATTVLPQPAPAAAREADAPPAGSTAPIKPNPVKTFAVTPGVVRAGLMPSFAIDAHRLAATENVTTAAIKREDAPAPGARPAKLAGAKLASANDSAPLPAREPPRARGAYMIQVGALDAEDDAKHRLASAKEKARSELAEAIPLTEKIEKGEKTLFRARFAGLEKSQAEAACRHLKRSEIPCFMLKN